MPLSNAMLDPKGCDISRAVRRTIRDLLAIAISLIAALGWLVVARSRGGAEKTAEAPTVSR